MAGRYPRMLRSFFSKNVFETFNWYRLYEGIVDDAVNLLKTILINLNEDIFYEDIF